MQTNLLTCGALSLILSLSPIMNHRRNVDPNERPPTPLLIETPIERRADLGARTHTVSSCNRTASPRTLESERGKPSSHVSMSQCLMSGSMSSRARPLRPRRSSRQGFRGRTSLGETHPNVLSPVARLKIRIPASRRPRSHPKWLNARLKADLLARICVRGKVRKAAQPKLCGRTAMRCRVRAAPRRRWL